MNLDFENKVLYVFVKIIFSHCPFTHLQNLLSTIKSIYLVSLQSAKDKHSIVTTFGGRVPFLGSRSVDQMEESQIVEKR